MSTPQGTFRIVQKHITTTMDSAVADHEFELRDVPWVMYFKGGYALHAAYWHDDFGRARSHGCVNVSPIDARYLVREHLARGARALARCLRRRRHRNRHADQHSPVKPVRLLLLLAFAACSRLPDFAAPKRIDSGSAEGRPVRRSHLVSEARARRFQAGRRPGPGETREVRARRADLRLDLDLSDTQLELVTTKEPDGQVTYTGTLKILRFRSLMDRKCSWWNPATNSTTTRSSTSRSTSRSTKSRRGAWVQKAAKLVKTTKVEADDKDEVVERLNALIKRVTRRAHRNRTRAQPRLRLGCVPRPRSKRQQKWWTTVQRELAVGRAHSNDARGRGRRCARNQSTGRRKVGKVFLGARPQLQNLCGPRSYPSRPPAFLLVAPSLTRNVVAQWCCGDSARPTGWRRSFSSCVNQG